MSQDNDEDAYGVAEVQIKSVSDENEYENESFLARLPLMQRQIPKPGAVLPHTRVQYSGAALLLYVLLPH